MDFDSIAMMISFVLPEQSLPITVTIYEEVLRTKYVGKPDMSAIANRAKHTTS